MKYTKEDIAKFKVSICPNCNSQGICTETFEDLDKHIPTCPKFFNYMYNYEPYWKKQTLGETRDLHQR